jgi:hypothetical protein
MEKPILRDTRFLHKPLYSNSRALIVGIDHYKSCSPLSYAVSDAQEIRDVLIEELKFPTENILLLTEADATRENIFRSFLTFAGEDSDLDERIIVFFAGHGHTRVGSRGEVGYLVPFDANTTDLATLIRWDDLTRNAELIRAKHMFFVMDACYGGLALTRSLQPGSTRFLKDMMLRYTRQVLTAGKANEVVADSGGPLPNHSIFTGHLIEGLRGKAATAEGVITANGLMAYVYQKVANDKNSNQTPHYGYFDGDGDLIFRAPSLNGGEEEKKKDVDELIVIPFPDEDPSLDTSERKVATVKQLLSDNSSSIQLHDFVIGEVRRFLSDTNEDHFAVQDAFSNEELLKRIDKYQRSVFDLSSVIACVAYWARPSHKLILQKALSRSADRLESQSGTVAWLHLRWYPLIMAMYCSGIAAVEGQRYDSLADMLHTKIGAPQHHEKDQYFVEAVTHGMLELTRLDLFNKLPGYERHYTPLSEYLFKILQPQLDDLLFIGKNYERSFDEFEVLLALISADIRKQNQGWFWGPIGRFGWKQRNHTHPPLTRVIEEAKANGDAWLPIKSGLFGGSFQRFSEVADEFQKTVAKLNWW